MKLKVSQTETWPFTATIVDDETGAVLLIAKAWSFSTDDRDPDATAWRNPATMARLRQIVAAANAFPELEGAAGVAVNSHLNGFDMVKPMAALAGAIRKSA